MTQSYKLPSWKVDSVFQSNFLYKKNPSSMSILITESYSTSIYDKELIPMTKKIIFQELSMLRAK